MRNRPERVLYRIERDGHRHVLRALHFEALPCRRTSREPRHERDGAAA